jgi:hypothetical protein
MPQPALLEKLRKPNPVQSQPKAGPADLKTARSRPPKAADEGGSRPEGEPKERLAKKTFWRLRRVV